MKKINLIPIAIILSVIVPSLAVAQSASTSVGTRPFKAVREIINQKRGEVQDLRQNLNQDAKAIRDQAQQVREEARDKTQAIRAELKTRQEEFRKTFEAKREEARQQLEVKREEFKEKLKTVRDERKKQIAEKLFNDINSLNVKAVNNLKKATDQIEEVLNRVLSRAEKAAANGNDIASVIAAGQLAKTAIRETRAAIEIQAGKIYSATISSEETLHANLKQIRDQLHSDLEAVKNKVKAARDAVRVTAVTLAQIPKVDKLEVSSQPATSTESAASGTPQ